MDLFPAFRLKTKITKVLLLLFLVFFCQQQTLPFATLRGAIDAIKYGLFKSTDAYVHGEITRTTLAEFNIVIPRRDEIVLANFLTDWRENGSHWESIFDSKKFVRPELDIYDPAHHFDRNKNDPDSVVFKRGAVFVISQRQIIINELRKPTTDLSEVVKALGMGLHALQDLCSHSNVVDLTRNEWEDLKRNFFAGSNPISKLRTAGYDKETGRDIEEEIGKLECTGEANKPFGHDACCKDEPDPKKKKNLESRRLVKPGTAFAPASGDMMKHDAAKLAAIELGKAWLTNIKTAVSATEWQKLLN